MRVVLDSNIIISAFATRGICYDIFKLCLSNHEIIVSEYLLQEVREGLINKIKVLNLIVSDIIEFIKFEVEIVIPTSLDKSVCQDPKDISILGTAISGDAEVIVSGDSHLLDLVKFKSVQILTPRKFWEYLKSHPQYENKRKM